MEQDNSREVDMMAYEEIADTNLQNHWSSWAEDISDGCRMPRMTEEQRAWWDQHYQGWPAVVTITVNGSEKAAEAVADAIRDAVRKGPRCGL